MSDYLDRQETRPPQTRETTLFRELRGLLSVARSRTPALRQQLRGVQIATIRKRADLAALPLIRKSDLPRLQAESPPFGGLVATRAAALRRILMSPGPILEGEGHARDWWGAARALHAAGFRKGDVVLNTFSYHLTPGGHLVDSGAQALGCTVIPAGPSPVDQQIEAIRRLQPTGFVGTPDFLKIILDAWSETGSGPCPLTQALVSGAALPSSLRSDLEGRGLRLQQCYATAELGVVAYETRLADGARPEGMVVNEGVIVEIVRPGTGEPVEPGEVGEIVVTRLNADCPLLRFATGDLSAEIPEPSPCGRTNTRLRGWLGRVDQTTKIKGMFVHPAQIADLRQDLPALGRLRLVVGRNAERDTMVLQAEAAPDDGALASLLAARLHAATRLHGEVEIVAPGSLPEDGKVICDERPLG